MIGGRNAVRTTYRGYQLIIDANDILAIAPDGDTHCAPSMSSIRSWVRKHDRLGGTKHNPLVSAPSPSLNGAVPPADLK